ncbi:Hypothetical predicted protein [Olea europaea subsp. europaea]|uniref:Uncharacterized protein n=1 Tax=Olea europaea subsp. europaea TaxID=158383 RepID=A0A8S0S8T1_OLEEU|nr:Hypothetical predicted protein [Olea europaea subsp. europaea]
MEEKRQKFKVKMMLPFDVYCEHCGFCMGKGNRFIAVKEEAGWETLFEIPIWRVFVTTTKSFSLPDSKVQKILQKPMEEKRQKFKVKMMLPFDVYCEHCGFCMGKGNRFVAVKEEAGWETLFEIPICRFKFYCYSCSTPFAIKTDRGRYDYIVEFGETLVPKNVKP